VPEPDEPEGLALDFEDHAVMADRFPRIWDRYGG
jgi:hypothetical protein